jgi:hypothetical protein
MPTIYFDVENERNKINMQIEGSFIFHIHSFGILNTLIISHNVIVAGSIVFFLSILCYNQIGGHVKDDLTKFGYRLDMKEYIYIYIYIY